MGILRLFTGGILALRFAAYGEISAPFHPSSPYMLVVKPLCSMESLS